MLPTISSNGKKFVTQHKDNLHLGSEELHNNNLKLAMDSSN